jgi:MFS family permease
MSPHPSAPSGRLLTGPFLALVASSLAFFVGGGMLLPVAPLFATGPVGLDAMGFGVAIGAFSLAALAVRPVVGWSSDRFGRRPLLIGGALLGAVATALHLGVDSFGPFVAVRAMLGIAEGMFLVAMLSGFADLAPPHRTGESLSLGTVALWTGIAIGPLIGEQLFGTGSYPAVWIGATALALLAAGLALAVPETRPAAATGARPRGRLFHPAGLMPGLLVLAAMWGMAGFLAFVPLHAQALGLEGAGPPLTVYGATVLAIRLGGARLPDRVGAARLSGLSLAVIAGGLSLLGLLPGFGGLLAGTAVFAVGIGLSVPAIMALAIERAPALERGSVVGTASVFLDISFGLAPVVLAPIAQAAGYPPTFLLSAVVAASGVGVLIVWRASVPSLGRAEG